MLQQIEEPCSLGAHAAVIVPPTWIIRVRRPQVLHITSLLGFLGSCMGNIHKLN